MCNPFFRRRIPWLLLLTASCALAACSGLTPYRRNLPEWVERVHVPMAVNKSFEPGLEELITNAFKAELVADGRLDLVNTGRRSDAVIRVFIEDYTESSAKFEDDDIERTRAVTLLLSAALYDPNDLEHAFATTEELPVEIGYRSDLRSVSGQLDVDARNRLAQIAGQTLLNAVMNQCKMTGP